VTYLALNQNQKAIEAFQQAAQTKADDPESLFNLGIAYNSVENMTKQRRRLVEHWR